MALCSMQVCECMLIRDVSVPSCHRVDNHIGSWAVSRLGSVIYPVMAPLLGPLLLEEYNQFHVGGVGDNAAWTGFMWNRLAGWLSDGTPDDPPLHAKQGEKVHRPESHRNRKHFVQSLKKLFSSEAKLNEFNITSKGSSGVYIGLGNAPHTSEQMEILKEVADILLDEYVWPFVRGHTDVEKFEELRREAHKRIGALSVPEKSLKTAKNVVNLDDAFITPVYSSSELKFKSVGVEVVGTGSENREFYGSSLVAVGTPGAQDLLVGSPGIGRTGGPQEGASSLLLNQGGMKSFRGGVGSGDLDAFPSYERFGHVGGACDFNGDGVHDLIICAPSFGAGRDVEAARGNYSGRCDLFFGPFLPSSNTAVPDMSIYGDRDWGHFGHALTIGDVDGDGFDDLVISAPFAGSYPGITTNDRGDVSSQGAVYVFLATSFPTLVNPSKRVNASNAADLVIQESASFQWLGKSLAIVPQDDVVKVPLLLVGAPSYHPVNLEDVNSGVGRVYAYTLTANKVANVWTVTGCSHASRTGHAVAVGSVNGMSYMAISEPTYNATKPLQMDDSVDEDLEAISSLSSMRNGEVLRSGRVLVISVHKIVESIASHETEGLDFKMCELENLLGKAAVKEVVGNEFDGRLGSAIEFRTSTNKFSESNILELIVGIPQAGYGAGAVRSVTIGEDEPKLQWILSGRKMFGGNSKSRLGACLTIVNSDVIIGAPFFSNENGEEVGSVVKVL